MASLFLSYAREDLDRARRLAEAIVANGHDVWWDRHIHGGTQFEEEIDRALKRAQAVLVLWSSAAIRSAWVKDEAAEGRDSGRLIPVLLEPIMPPLGFRQYHSVDLAGWDGDEGADALHDVLRAIGALASGRESGETAETVAPARPDRVAICVLPFANMSGDAEQEYFSDGISEDIITDLSKVSSLAVTARNTAFTYKGTAVEVPAVARRLGVSHVLEGSVRKSGNRLRITAQLIDGATGNHVWAERYDRDLTDIFDVQTELSEAIVAALKLKLLPEEKKALEQRCTCSPDAYNLYLMARQYWVTGNHGDRRREQRVVRICSRAVELDPRFAQAWALMALAQANLRFGFGEGNEDGLAAAEKALAIDPGIAEAHCVKARNLAEHGRMEEAQKAMAAAVALNPDSWEVNKEAARLHMLQRRVPEAMRHYEKAVALMEGDYHAWAMLLTCYSDQGDRAGVERAARMMVKQAESALAEDPGNGSALGIGAGGLAALGEVERAREWIERALLIDPDNRNMRYNFACVLAAQLNDPEGALELMETTLPTGSLSGQRTWIRLAETDPDFDSIRDHPRFVKMLAEARKRVEAAPTTEATPAAG